ncbi:hypothetical protein COLO4_21390 [Corchorus olitorius]|uniref:Uncharacterized protein n=1 Tax=Corchorus olitorius TaxID=93759 RepID=A0A1R3ITN9_9ROSI|nr:hypothetical protein COLO4_21390 [Corchorus olitorius]
MEPADPFCEITKICHGAFGEDSQLQSCSYFGQSGSSDVSGFDSGRKTPPDIPVASTGIIMASPDDGDTVSLHADSSDSMKVVDSEVESTLRFEAISTPKGALLRKPEENVVSKRGFSPKGQSSTEPPSKKQKSLNFELPSIRLGSPEEEFELEGQQNHELKDKVGEGSVKGKRVDFSTEVIDFDSEERNVESQTDNGEGNSGRNKKSLEDANQFVSNSGEMEPMEVKTKNKRVLPPWPTSSRRSKGSVEVNGREPVQAGTGSDGVSEERNMKSQNDNDEGNSGRNKKSLEDTNQFGSNSIRMEAQTEKKRVLPPWLTSMMRREESVEVNEREPVQVQVDTDSDSVNENLEEVSVLDVLADLEEDGEDDDDGSLECLSLLEVAQRAWGPDFLTK